MCNSLQDYRCKVGTFMNNRGSRKCKVLKNKNFVRKQKSSMFNLAFLLIFLVSSFHISSHYEGENITKQSNHSTSIHSSYDWSDNCQPSSVEKVNINFQARYKYGNKQKNGLKIMHWNGGGKHLVNKINNIESVVNGYKPAILGISESNFLKHHDINDVQIENYKLFMSNTIRNEDIGAS